MPPNITPSSHLNYLIKEIGKKKRENVIIFLTPSNKKINKLLSEHCSASAMERVIEPFQNFASPKRYFGESAVNFLNTT